MSPTDTSEILVDSTQAFKEILDIIRQGPQCPCGIALRIGLPEREIYPYLAEMLARDWVALSVPSLKGQERAAKQRQLIDRLASALGTRVATVGADEEDLIDASQKWYDF